MMRIKTIIKLSIAWAAFFAGEQSGAQPPAGKGYVLLFEDSFEGDKLNEDHWAYRLGRRTGGGYIDGLNLKENVAVKNGALHIRVNHEMIDGKFENTGGGVISRHNFGYGYYECLSKPFMKGRGVHTSFWQASSLRPNNNVFEIDSYEIDSKSFMGCNNLYVNIRAGERRVPWPHRAQVPFTLDGDGWFLDAYEFTPDGVIFYDNGREVAKAEWRELTAAQSVWLTALNGCGEVDEEAQPGESVFEYFRYYAKDYPGINLLPNGSFEYNQDFKDPFTPIGWISEGTQTAACVAEGGASRDRYKLRMGGNGAFHSFLYQDLEFITNGEYLLTADVRSSDTHRGAKIKVKLFGGREMSVNVPTTAKWKKVIISGIMVTENQARIEIEATGNGNEWLEIDNINFMKPAADGVVLSDKPEAFNLLLDPVWHLAKEEPINFEGDGKFYFFDRNVGFGEAITVSFTVNAAQMGNMTPIARIPEKGISGWAISLKEDGSVVFRIGSVQNHYDVIAENAYKAGEPNRITCVFDKGEASIYVDGKLLTQHSGIIQNTLEKETAGRLGTVGKAYEAVNDVIVQTGEADDDTPERMNFRGTLHNVAIYNRAVKSN